MKKLQKDSSVNHTTDAMVDTKSKNAVDWFSALSISSGNTHKIWQSIEKRLENMDKRIMMWFMAMTTTFTLLVAAGLEYGDEIHLFDTEPGIELPNKLAVIPNDTHLAKKTTPVIALQKTNSKQFEIKSEEPKSTITVNTIQEQLFVNQPISQDWSSSAKSVIKSKISLQGEFKYINRRVLPGVGLDVQLMGFAGKNGTHSIHLGWTSSFDFAPPKENGSKQQALYNFAKVGYGYTNEKGKGWQVESGYLLNPDGHLFENTTIKMSVHRKINRHIRFGSEVIFTDSFQQVMPALSVLISS